MSPRNRRKNRPNVPHLTVREKGKDIHYGWKDPRTGKENSLYAKNDPKTAVKRAVELNKILIEEMNNSVVKKVSTYNKRVVQRKTDMTFDDFRPIYLSILKTQRRYVRSSLAQRKSHCNAWSRRIGDRPLIDLEVWDVAEVLNEYRDAGKETMAQSLRNTLLDMINVAREEGYLPARHENAAKFTRAPKVVVKRARLTLESWQQIRHEANQLQPWVGTSCDLAMATGLRRSDISVMQYRKGRDWQTKWIAWQKAAMVGQTLEIELHPYPYIENDLLHVVLFKGKGNLIQLPLDLKQDATGLKLGDVIKRSRRRAVSRYVVHHDRKQGVANPGESITMKALSGGFQRARERTDLDWGEEKPPSFHEQRSLAERLYRKQGYDTQALLGHRDRRMTEIYDDPRAAEWTLFEI